MTAILWQTHWCVYIFCIFISWEARSNYVIWTYQLTLLYRNFMSAPRDWGLVIIFLDFCKKISITSWEKSNYVMAWSLDLFFNWVRNYQKSTSHNKFMPRNYFLNLFNPNYAILWVSGKYKQTALSQQLIGVNKFLVIQPPHF